MRPQITTGVINQKSWPRAGDYDDCWAVANMTAVHAVAPWLRLRDIPDYRAAAGNPDDPTRPDGGTIRQNARATRTLWPRFGQLIEVSEGDLTYKQFAAKVKAGHVASLFIISAALPVPLQFGFKGGHAVAVAFDDGYYRLANPLAPAHSRWIAIAESVLEKAVKSWPGEGAWAIVMPTPEQAFQVHPLLGKP